MNVLPHLKDLFIIEHKTSKPNFITEEIVKKLKKLIKLAIHQII